MDNAVIRQGGSGGLMAATTKIRPVARSLFSGRTAHPAQLLVPSPVYRTELGAAYATDALSLLKGLPDACANAVITSPPYALHFKREYGNVDKRSYVQWTLPFAREINES